MNVEQLQKTAHFQQLRQNAEIVGKNIQGKAFADVLQDKLTKAAHPVKFSSHAVERLASRNIVLNENDLTRLNQAVETISEKGGKESLLLMRDMAFIVSVENRTVITAIDNQPGDNNKVFTNIDSALIM